MLLRELEITIIIVIEHTWLAVYAVSGLKCMQFSPHAMPQSIENHDFKLFLSLSSASPVVRRVLTFH